MINKICIYYGIGSLLWFLCIINDIKLWYRTAYKIFNLILQHKLIKYTNYLLIENDIKLNLNVLKTTEIVYNLFLKREKHRNMIIKCFGECISETNYTTNQQNKTKKNVPILFMFTYVMYRIISYKKIITKIFDYFIYNKQTKKKKKKKCNFI
eukprot:420363_1